MQTECFRFRGEFVDRPLAPGVIDFAVHQDIGQLQPAPRVDALLVVSAWHGVSCTYLRSTGPLGDELDGPSHAVFDPVALDAQNQDRLEFLGVGVVAPADHLHEAPLVGQNPGDVRLVLVEVHHGGIEEVPVGDLPGAPVVRARLEDSPRRRFRR